MKIVIIIPTYNEAHNIEPLIQALQTQFLRINHEMHILVVDDNSPDGTADKVRGLMGVNPEIHLITGEKQGLGRAYIRGMQHALDGLKADAVMEMDADFSHRPEDVPGLIAALEDGGDFIIGSRYATGGKIPKEWGLWRTALSRWGNVYARYLTGLSQVRDCTAGFRVIKASLLRRLDLTGLRVKGYAFQIALLNQALLQKAVIKEVPVAFLGRVRGHKKVGLADIWEFFLMAWWMRFQNNDTFIKLAAVGISGILVNLGCFILLVHGGLSKFIASPLAIELSIISNFIFNN
jgi:dolichol-phosphate mannosyltransferase